jgi:hypothetical protein
MCNRDFWCVDCAKLVIRVDKMRESKILNIGLQEFIKLNIGCFRIQSKDDLIFILRSN